jgi:hypothetical protein
VTLSEIVFVKTLTIIIGRLRLALFTRVSRMGNSLIAHPFPLS